MPQIIEVAGQARWPLRSFTTWMGNEGPRAGSYGRVGGRGKAACVCSLLLRDPGKGRQGPGAVAQGRGEAGKRGGDGEGREREKKAMSVKEKEEGK